MEKEILYDLGLTHNEVEIYLVLLGAGSISVNEIAERSGLHRQAVYDALERLLEKGFVSYVQKNSKKYFQGIHPEKIKNYLDEKKEKFMTLLPELVKLTTLPREDTFVEVAKGKGVVRVVYRDIVSAMEKSPGEILISGVDEKMFLHEDKIAMAQYLGALRRLNCHERVLVKAGDTRFVQGKQTRYRWMPPESFSPTPVFVYAQSITMVIWGNPTYVVMVKSAQLADTYRKQFYVLWNASRSPRSVKTIRDVG